MFSSTDEGQNSTESNEKRETSTSGEDAEHVSESKQIKQGKEQELTRVTWPDALEWMVIIAQVPFFQIL